MDDNNETISAFAFKTAKEIEQLVKERTNNETNMIVKTD